MVQQVSIFQNFLTYAGPDTRQQSLLQYITQSQLLDLLLSAGLLYLLWKKLYFMLFRNLCTPQKGRYHLKLVKHTDRIENPTSCLLL